MASIIREIITDNEKTTVIHTNTNRKEKPLMLIFIKGDYLLRCYQTPKGWYFDQEDLVKLKARTLRTLSSTKQFKKGVNDWIEKEVIPYTSQYANLLEQFVTKRRSVKNKVKPKALKADSIGRKHVKVSEEFFTSCLTSITNAVNNMSYITHSNKNSCEKKIITALAKELGSSTYCDIYTLKGIDGFLKKVCLENKQVALENALSKQKYFAF